MKKIYVILLTLICLMGFGLSFNKVEAAGETLVYTMEPISNASNTNYDRTSEVTIDGITWSVNANQQSLPWKIGGKNGTFNRLIKSNSSINQKITLIEVSIGTINITFNSLTLNVYSNESKIDNVIINNPTASSVISFSPNSGIVWQNCIYEFIFNVSTTQTSNKYVQLNNIKFFNTSSNSGDNITSGSGDTNNSTGESGNNSNTSYNYVEITSAAELLSSNSPFVIGASESNLVKKINNSDDIFECNDDASVEPVKFLIEKYGNNVYIKTNDGDYIYSQSNNLASGTTKENWQITDYYNNNTFLGIKLNTADNTSRGLLYRNSANGIKYYSYTNATSDGYSLPKIYRIDYSLNITAFENLSTLAGLYLYDDQVQKYDIRFGTNNLGDGYVSTATYGVLLANGNVEANVTNLQSIIDSTKTTPTTLSNFITTYSSIYSLNYMDCTEKVSNGENTNHEFYWRVNDVFGHADYKFYAVMYMELEGKVYFAKPKNISVNDICAIYYVNDTFTSMIEIKERIEKILADGGILK